MSKKKGGNYNSVATNNDFHGVFKPEPVSFGQFLFNSKEGTILGRSPLSWTKIILFFTIFYSVLIAFFAVCMHVFMMTIDENVPSRILGDSIIGTNPGVGFIPIDEDDTHGALIWFDTKNKTTGLLWAKRIDEMLNGYYNKSKLPDEGRNQVACDFETPRKNNKNCLVPIDEWNECNRNNSYGYSNAAPCIFLKLNRIYNWVPDMYNDPTDLPDDMPEELKLYIAKLPEAERNQVWITCKGEQPLDVENIGPIQYVSRRGLPAYYFPYVNTPGYLSPLVAVRLERPKTNTIINIECRAWAKNIIYHGGNRDRSGSVHLEMLID
ncbi:sodium/potassium-transporting ATPase subunit beta-2-like [Culicoides brevitarsis]|uniref:sodium/potassium-transporting ATPase subunit beta-2-like n=1 Tax=Culicoides brevitarsis TaxID=469753 RepID=UPI00307B67E4